MHRFWGFLGGIFVLALLSFGGNVLAQRVLPTFISDSVLRRLGYRLVFVACVFLEIAACLLVIWVLNLAGYRI